MIKIIRHKQGKDLFHPLCLVVLCSLLFCWGGQGWAKSWQLVSVYLGDARHQNLLTEFVHGVESLPNANLKVDIYNKCSLIPNKNLLTSVVKNDIQLAELLMAELEHEDALFGLDNIPFIATDLSEAQQLWEISREQVQQRLDNLGLHLLLVAPWPPQGIFTVQPLASLVDLRGGKLRTYSTETALLARYLGAEAIHVPHEHLRESWLTGQLDAMITSPVTAVTQQAWQYIKYYYDIQAWIPKNMLVINRSTWQSLSIQERQTLTKLASKLEAQAWRNTRQHMQQALLTMQKHGIQVVSPNPKLVAQLRHIGHLMTARWARNAGQVGREILGSYRKYHKH
ncbi:TRAP transporter substrate-binding protein DctP [Zooshikella harenae]|uniref:TRAP transporter substrate-binding protein DctP n=1 Tax=Zooshikella harenae TaxID=2827238 RepID=A0ABS5Z9I3_9GAMM|nr:TRAP transporter substrate-binding protein DctP [Zooshikella harenae]MBU2710711.1 TRAP transporter substrate-binding protein DctP [Zooshikella harenae]